MWAARRMLSLASRRGAAALARCRPPLPRTLRAQLVRLPAPHLGRSAPRRVEPPRPLLARALSAGAEAACAPREKRAPPVPPKLPTLKQQMRRLALRVHPDFLQGFDEQRKSNEQSLAKLNSLLLELEAPADRQQARAERVDLLFFLKRDAPQQQPPQQPQAHPPHAPRVDVSVSVVEVGGVSFSRLRLSVDFEGASPHSRAGRALLYAHLSALFKACGFGNGMFLWSEDGDLEGAVLGKKGSVARKFAGVASLVDFLRGVREEVTGLAAETRQRWVERQILLTRFRVDGLRILFEALLPDQQTALLYRLKDLMEGPGSDPEAVKARLREFILVFHGSAQASSVDARGRLELAAADTNEDWLEFVNSADVKALSELRIHAWNVTVAKEKEVASKLGLLHLFCEPALLSDPSYLAFLSRLDAAAPAFQALLARSPKLREVVLRVCGSSDLQRFRVDPTMGFVNVPVDADADRVRLVLEMRGPEAHGVAGRFRSSAEERGSVSLQAKRRLRLRGLEVSGEVSEAQFVLCCRRLAFAQAPIPALLQGLNLRVSDRFDCDDDGTVSIRWDWS